jgi:PKD repeat protein
VSFNWDFGDGTTGAFADGSHEYVSPGIYNAVVTVTEKTSPFLKSSQSFVVRVGVPAALAVIDAPAPGTLYEIGVPIKFSGHVDGIPDTNVSYQWSVLQIHNEHTHLVTEIDGKSGSMVPTEHTDNTSHELCLFVDGGEGASDVQCVRLMGKTSAYTFNSEPMGAPIVYLDEEKEVAAPYLAHPIVGSRQSIAASRIFAGRSFVGWSDGEKNAARTFLTGLAPKAFTAIYKNLPPKGVVATTASGQTKRGRKREIRLDASGSKDPEGEALRFDWRFSDGHRFRSASIRKRFARDGRYAVRLTVRDSLGGTHRLRNGLIVRGANPVKLTRR